MDCGGKRSATPLLHLGGIIYGTSSRKNGADQIAISCCCVVQFDYSIRNGGNHRLILLSRRRLKRRIAKDDQQLSPIWTFDLHQQPYRGNYQFIWNPPAWHPNYRLEGNDWHRGKLRSWLWHCLPRLCEHI